MNIIHVIHSRLIVLLNGISEQRCEPDQMALRSLHGPEAGGSPPPDLVDVKW